ncbi:hypothetical protein HK098_003582 [Nowakowskiella sp. JEL0407]|nr:hypothetical protein HK098_003582 [Nowakowskiella sp. JEL0407]
MGCYSSRHIRSESDDLTLFLSTQSNQTSLNQLIQSNPSNETLLAVNLFDYNSIIAQKDAKIVNLRLDLQNLKISSDEKTEFIKERILYARDLFLKEMADRDEKYKNEVDELVTKIGQLEEKIKRLESSSPKDFRMNVGMDTVREASATVLVSPRGANRKMYLNLVFLNRRMMPDVLVMTTIIPWRVRKIAFMFWLITTRTLKTETTLTARFNFVKTLGEGPFGRVFLVESNTTSNTYAVKTISRTVRKVVAMYETESHQFSFMDFYGGGDLYSVMLTYQSTRFQLHESIVKFYAAEIILGIEYVHEQGFMFRDLKLENVMVDAQGHIKIVDFGGATEIEGGPIWDCSLYGPGVCHKKS